MIAFNNSNCEVVYKNLRKYMRRWVMAARVLERMGTTVRVRVEMYRAVAQLVLFYSSKIWVVTRGILKVLEGLHHRAARQITGMTAKRGAGGEWEYPSVVEAMETAGIHPIGVYKRRRQAPIA